MRQRSVEVDGARWRGLYEAGWTVEAIALEEEVSRVTVGKYLRLAGTEMRPRGAQGTVRAGAGNRSNAAAPRTLPAVHVAARQGGGGLGKRRRSSW